MPRNLREALLQLTFDQGVKELVEQITPFLQAHFGFERVAFIDATQNQIEKEIPGDLPDRLREGLLLGDALSKGETLQSAYQGTDYACVPVLTQTSYLGALLVAKQNLSSKELEQVAIVADYLGIRLTAAHHLQRRHYIHRFLSQLAKTPDLGRLLDELVAELKNVIQFDACDIFLYDQEYGLVRAGSELDEPQRCSIALKVFHERKPLRIDAACHCPLGWKSGWGIPINHFNGPLGVICLGNYSEHFPDHHLEAAIETLTHAAIAIYNAQQHRLNDDLEQLKSEFISTVSHELRTPLTSIKGFVETLAKPDLLLPPEQRKHIYNILTKQTERLSALVEELLDLSQLEAGNCEMNTREVRIDSLIGDTLKLMAGILAPFAVETDLAPITVGVDSNRLGQALINLLENAAKYSPPGSKIRIQLHEEKGGSVIKVQDQGIGIAPEDRRKLFHKFQRLDNSLTRATGGTGLGLYISAKILAAHGGKLWVETPSWGKGACFVMFLPFSPLNNQQGRD